MKPFKPDELMGAGHVSEEKISGLVQKINDGLVDSYDEGDNWKFAYHSECIDKLNNRERLRLKQIFQEAGYEARFDSGVPYDEQPIHLVVSYDTRKGWRKE